LYAFPLKTTPIPLLIRVVLNVQQRADLIRNSEQIIFIGLGSSGALANYG